jgi:hypothetical protein
MTTLTVCNNHPQRKRDLTLFRYVDAHAVVYEMHLCPGCAADERDTYEWNEIDGGFELRRPLTLE